MKIDGRLFIVFIMALALMPVTYGETCMGGGISAGVQGEGSQSGAFTANANGVSGGSSGTGDFSYNEWVSNTAASYARVGIDIKGAESYIYGYDVNPGRGAGWPNSTYPEVSASESLDVKNALFIKTFANARDAKGSKGTAITEILDLRRKGSLEGFKNEAIGKADGISLTQSNSDASGTLFRCEISANAQKPNTAKAAATLTGSYAENLQNEQTVSMDSSYTEAYNNAVINGVASASTLARDTSGNEAKSQVSFRGVFNEEQYAWADPASGPVAKQSTHGVGYFAGAMTSAKDTMGKEAMIQEVGSFSGNVITNRLQADISSPGFGYTTHADATQEVEFEYLPIRYRTFTYDRPIDFSFIISAKEGDSKKARAQIDVSKGEFVQIMNEIAAGGVINNDGTNVASEININSNILGIGSVSTLAKYNNSEVKSLKSFVGAFSEEQFAQAYQSSAYDKQSTKGVGYFTGVTSSAKIAGGNEAIAKEVGAFSGNVQSRQEIEVDTSGSDASQEVSLAYFPHFTYRGRTYDSSSMTFSSLAKADGIANTVTANKRGVKIPYNISQDVSVP